MLHAKGAANPVDSTLEYYRPVRSLKLWLAFRVYGAAAFRDWIGQSIVHARDLADKVIADPDFELLHEPTLSTVCFRHLRATNLNEHNQAPPRRSNATVASTSPPRCSTATSAYARVSRTFAPSPNTSTSCCESPGTWPSELPRNTGRTTVPSQEAGR